MSQLTEKQMEGLARTATRAGTAMGIATLILGTLCILAPFFSGVAVTIVVAVLLVAAGIARTIFAFQAESFGRGVLVFLFGALSILCGIAMFANPLYGVAALTAVLTAYFLADGILGIINGFRARPAKGFGWMIFSGIVSLLLAFMIAREWPVSGQWAIGILVGVNLITTGWSMIMLGTVEEAVLDEARA